MLFIDKIVSSWDEEILGKDSAYDNRDEFKLSTPFYVRGRLDGDDDADYYLINSREGLYNIFVSTEGLNSSLVTRGSLKVEIVDENGRDLGRERLFSPDIETEHLSIKTRSEDEKYYLKISGTRDFNYQAVMYPADVGPSPIDADDPQTGMRREMWRLLTTDGFAGSIGGSRGQVYGTEGFQSIFVIDAGGILRFDASFNRGGDVISLGGEATEWHGVSQGSFAFIQSARSTALIPAGAEGLVVKFEDGSHLLKFNDSFSAILVGNTMLSSDDAITSINRPAQDLDIPDGYDPEAVARLLVQTGGAVSAQGNLEIFGTSGGEEINLQPSTATLDASFNQGGDALFLQGDISDFEASVVGSSVLIEGGGYFVAIPVGITGMELVFSDAAATLFYDLRTEHVFIGDQVIGEYAAALFIV